MKGQPRFGVNPAVELDGKRSAVKGLFAGFGVSSVLWVWEPANHSIDETLA